MRGYCQCDSNSNERVSHAFYSPIRHRRKLKETGQDRVQLGRPHGANGLIRIGVTVTRAGGL